MQIEVFGSVTVWFSINNKGISLIDTYFQAYLRSILSIT